MAATVKLSQQPRTESCVVPGTWEGPGQAIMLKLYGPDGEVAAVPLSTTRALTLGKELLDCGVLAIKADWPG